MRRLRRGFGWAKITVLGSRRDGDLRTRTRVRRHGGCCRRQFRNDDARTADRHHAVRTRARALGKLSSSRLVEPRQFFLLLRRSGCNLRVTRLVTCLADSLRCGRGTQAVFLLSDLLVLRAFGIALLLQFASPLGGGGLCNLPLRLSFTRLLLLFSDAAAWR
jgi:hypothetical protein